MSKNNKEVVTSNLLWRLLERFGAQGVTFVVSMALGKLLDPEVYGTIALITIFTSILQVFVDSGLGNALIQKKEVDDVDYSTVFYFNVFFCLVLYGVMFLCAPVISVFYNLPELIPVIRVLSLTIVISGVKNIQQAYVSRNMLFKKFFFATLWGTIGAAIIGIYMAYKGYGIWALVVQAVFNATIDTLVLWITVKWRPKRCFSWTRLKTLYSYGWKLLVAKLVDTVYEDVRTLIVGKKYSSVDLALYNRGKQFPEIAVSNLNSSIESVLFPTMSKEQDNIARVKEMTSRAISVTSYCIFPIMAGLIACGTSLINVVLNYKWANCVPFMRIFCLGYAIVPITLSNLNAIKAIGRSDLYLKLEISRKIINTISLLVFMWYGPMAIAVSYLINCIVNVFINSFPNKKLLNYGYIDQAKDLAPALILSSVMGLIVYSVSLFHFSDLITLIIQIPLGILVYILGSKLFKIETLDYLLSTVRGIMKRHKT